MTSAAVSLTAGPGELEGSYFAGVTHPTNISFADDGPGCQHQETWLASKLCWHPDLALQIPFSVRLLPYFLYGRSVPTDSARHRGTQAAASNPTLPTPEPRGSAFTRTPRHPATVPARPSEHRPAISSLTAPRLGSLSIPVSLVGLPHRHGACTGGSLHGANVPEGAEE